MNETTAEADRYIAEGYCVFDREERAAPVARVRGDSRGLYHARIIAEALSQYVRERPDLYKRGSDAK